MSINVTVSLSPGGCSFERTETRWTKWPLFSFTPCWGKRDPCRLSMGHEDTSETFVRRTEAASQLHLLQLGLNTERLFLNGHCNLIVTIGPCFPM